MRLGEATTQGVEDTVRFKRKISGLVVAALAAAALSLIPTGVAHADTAWGGIYAQNLRLRCLDVRREDDYNHANARIQTYNCTGSPQQQWSTHPYGLTPPAGEFGIRRTLFQIINLRSGMCMEVRTGDLVPDRQIDQFPCGTGSIDSIASQLWLASPTYYSSGQSTGMYQLAPWSAVRFNASLCLDIRNGSTDNEAMLAQNPCNGDWNQQFGGSLMSSG